MSRKHDSLSSGSGGQMMHIQKWVTPIEGTLKLNVDASVIQGSTSFRVGMLLRDHFIHDKCMHFAGEVSALEAESIGICEALSWMLSRCG